MHQNFNNMDTAIEEAMADERLDSIDIEYLIDQIDIQLDNLMSSDNKKNYLKSFEKQLEDISVLHTETDTKNIRNSVYNLIIQKISEKFDMVIDTEDISIKKVAKQFYKFFVLNYVNNLSYFIKSYIIENKDDIINSLKHMDHISTKKIHEVNGDIAIIMNNIGDVVDIINSRDIEFDEFLEYLGKHPESSSCVEEMKEYANDIIEDSESIVRLMLQPLVNEEEDFGEVYVNIQMDLYNDFNEEIEEDE